MSNIHEKELRFLESSLKQKTFTAENTTLFQVNKDFPHIGKNTFTDLLEESFQKKDFSAAQEIELPAGFGENIWIVDFFKHLDHFRGLKIF